MTDDILGPEALAQAQADFHRLAGVQIHLDINGVAAFQLLAHLQLASRHPGQADHFSQPNNMARQFAEQLAAAVSITPALARLVQAGWDPHQDLPKEGRKGDL